MFIKILRAKYDIFLFPCFAKKDENREYYAGHLKSMGIKIITPSDFGRANFSLELLVLLKEKRFKIIWFDFLFIFEIYYPYLKDLLKDVPVFLTVHDLNYPWFDIKIDILKRKLKYHIGEYKKIELRNYEKADFLITTSEADKEQLLKENPDFRIKTVPTPFEPHKGSRRKPGKDLLFIGDMHRGVNIDAMRYFRKNIFPLIKKEIPEVRLFIVGSSPDKKKKKAGDDGIVETGWVSDLSGYLDSCRVFVAPMRWGGGIKNKLIQAMWAGLPIVSTSAAAEGMGFSDNRNILIADDPADFAEKVVLLYRDTVLSKKLAASALSLARSTYSMNAVKEKLIDLFEKYEFAR